MKIKLYVQKVSCLFSLKKKKSSQRKALLERLNIVEDHREMDERNLLDLTFRISKQPLVEPAGLLIMNVQVFLQSLKENVSLVFSFILGVQQENYRSRSGVFCSWADKKSSYQLVRVAGFVWVLQMKTQRPSFISAPFAFITAGLELRHAGETQPGIGDRQTALLRQVGAHQSGA